MKRYSLLLHVLLLAGAPAFAQKASDVIENGIKVRSGHDLYLKLEGAEIKHAIKETTAGLRFKQLQDSAMLLPVEASVLIYLRPLNPLNFTFKGENKIIVDPVDEAAATALNSIVDFVSKNVTAKIAASTSANEDTTKTFNSFCVEFKPLVDNIKRILDALKDDKKGLIAQTFTELKNLDFETPDETKKGVEKAEASIKEMASYFNDLEKNTDELKTLFTNTSCVDAVQDFVVRRAFADALKDIGVTFSNQKKRLTNLQKAFKLVQAKQQEASKNDWLVLLNDVPADRGKISLFTVTVNEAGYALSAEGEIVESAVKERAKKVLRVRRFQRLVPEVAVGVAYTNLSFPKYSANADASGKNFVAAAGEDKVDKVNFTTMINYNLFLSNSPIHPFWQLGIGLNTNFPTLLTGLGLRINALGARRLALTFGLATSWIKTLDKLKVGDAVSGPADVEKDVQYKFNTRPKTYFGLQYNF